MKEKLNEVLNSERNCIKEPRDKVVQISVCGNGKGFVCLKQIVVLFDFFNFEVFFRHFGTRRTV